LALSSLFLLVREKKNSLSPIDQGSSSLFSYPAGHGGASPSRSLTLLRLSAAVTSSRDLFLGPGAVELGWKRPKGCRAGASLALSQAFQSREREREREQRERRPTNSRRLRLALMPASWLFSKKLTLSPLFKSSNANTSTLTRPCPRTPPRWSRRWTRSPGCRRRSW
jgi:hypothetical protein